MSKSKKTSQPLWRPNFVDASELPDIKVVRTDFIVNFVAVTVMLGLLFVVAKREYRAFSLNNTISDMQTQVASEEPADKGRLTLSQKFVSEAKYIAEAERFFRTPLLPHEFLLGLSEIRPKDLIFKTVSFREISVKVGKKNTSGYNVFITGDARNLTVLNDFKSILEDSELLELEAYTVEIGEALEARNDKTGIFPYRLSIELRPAKPAKAGGKK